MKAEQSQGEAMRELREAEAAAIEQESLLLRAAALEDKLKESRAEQGQLDTYKQVNPILNTKCMLFKLIIQCVVSCDVYRGIVTHVHCKHHLVCSQCGNPKLGSLTDEMLLLYTI